MLGKMFKHEWKAVSKFGCIILLAQLVIALLGNIYYRSAVWAGLFDENGELANLASATWLIFGVLGLLFIVLVLAGGFYAIYIYMGIRFYKSMYTDEGYLTHTLPISSHKLLLSKIFAAGIWTLILTVTMMVTILSLVIAMMASVMEGQQVDMSLWSMLCQVYEVISELYATEMGINLSAVGIVTLITVLIGPFLSMTTLFGALTIGQLSKKHKGLMGVLAYLVVMLAEALIGMIIGVASMSSSIVQMIEGDTEIGMNGVMLTSYVVSYTVAIVMYVVSHYIMKNKLNLD